MIDNAAMVLMFGLGQPEKRLKSYVKKRIALGKFKRLVEDY